MYQHSKTKKKRENWRDDYTQLMGIITGKHYQNSAEAFYAFPVLRQNELLQHSDSDAKAGESQFLQLEQEWAAGEWNPSERVIDSR